MPRGPAGRAGFLDNPPKSAEERRQNYKKYRWRKDYLARISKHLDAAKRDLSRLMLLLNNNGGTSLSTIRQLRLELERQCRDYQRLERKAELLTKLLRARTLGLIDLDRPKRPVPKALRFKRAKTVADLVALEQEIAAEIRSRMNAPAAPDTEEQR